MQAEIASGAATRKMVRRIDLLGFASAWLVAMVACSPMDDSSVILIVVGDDFDVAQNIVRVVPAPAPVVISFLSACTWLGSLFQ